MQSKKIIQSLGFAVFLCFSYLISAQPKSTINGQLKTTEVVRELGDIKVIITQFKQLDYTDPRCRAMIRIVKNDLQTDTVVYPVLEPVGSHYGLLVYSELFQDHLVISKFNDYDGQTVIINNKGKVFEFPGGYIFYDQNKELLFSAYASDVGGLSVFDLKSDCLFFSTTNLVDHPCLIYLNKLGHYFFSGEHWESAGRTESSWAIDLDQKTLKKCDVDLKSSDYTALRCLADYPDIEVSCE
jgi:hypothetical protein